MNDQNQKLSNEEQNPSGVATECLSPTQEHSPLPWKEIEGLVFCTMQPTHGMFDEQPAVAACSAQRARDASFVDSERYGVMDARSMYVANAKLIVRCVNSHDALIAALETAYQQKLNDAAMLDDWSHGSRKGGWSTHLCTPLENTAERLRREAQDIRRVLRNAKTTMKRD